MSAPKLRLERGRGPERAIGGRPRTGLVSTAPWRCAITTEGARGRTLRATLSVIDHVIRHGDELRWAALPDVAEPLRAVLAVDGWRLDNVAETAPADPRTRADAGAGVEFDAEARFAATGVAVDLLFDDGTRLSQTALRDQHGNGASPEEQFEARTLLVEQWNLRRVDLGGLAGRRAVRIEVGMRVPEGLDPRITELTAWLDDVRIGSAVSPAGSRPSDRVRTTRGTHSSPLYSRGNTLPAVGLPHGAIMATPVTRASDLHWLYSWHGHNDAENSPRLQAFATTLAPSPWIGERAAFQVMPTVMAGTPDPDPEARALRFSHERELDRPHHYAVELDGGIRGELAPARQAVAMRFYLPEETGALIFDQPTGGGALEIRVRGDRTVIRAQVDTTLERVPVVPRMYVHAEADRPAVSHALLPQADRPGVTGYARFGAGDVELRIGCSFVSYEQAEANLRHDLPGDFARARDEAQRVWDDRLSACEVEGATEDQLVTLYSNLYRVLLFPGTAHESAASPPQHASPAPGADPAALPVRAGRLTVNNGYWDTYRTSWPLLALLDPDGAGELLDGVVQHFRDTGWTTRWSAPGHVDVMVGTSSDAVLADAALKGVPGFDLVDAYDSALRNATVPAPSPEFGRKGLETSIFRGWTSTEIWEGMSWSIEAAVNDAAIGELAAHLAAHGPVERREALRAEALYFRTRGLAYRNLFDPRVGFFQGRAADGAFRWDPDSYDPSVWGTDYVETNGWGMAFSAPHDGAGLAMLHGGPDGLAAKLERFFATPERGGDAARGVYSYVVHEISEASDIRMGMFAPSNQPAHHIPAMALFAGRPDIAQRIARESLARLFLGSEIGQGYPGDEDNGEMSAWWLWNALGLYPLAPGLPGYAVVSPLFPRMKVRLPGGRALTIVAHENAPDRPYVRELRVDGEPWRRTWIPHDVLARGAVIEFTMSAEPSVWGTGPDDAPPSLSTGTDAVAPLVDVASSATIVHSRGIAATSATDDDSRTAVEVAPGEWIELTLAASASPVLYTVTSAAPVRAAWILEVADGAGWRIVDERTEQFRWAPQTRPFLLDGVGGERFRLRVAGDTALPLAEVELLTHETASPPPAAR